VIHLDSSFVIDLLREQARKRSAATAWLEAHAAEPMGVSLFVLCELEAGAAAADDPDAERDRVRTALQAVAKVLPDDRFAAKYGALLQVLHRRGRPIGAMDLLIATTAVLDAAPLVTGNASHFAHVPGLRVLSYR